MFTPEEVLDNFKTRKIKLIPPQIYELRRMLKFQSFEAFSKYSLHRQKYGVRKWLPKFSKDLKLGILPGKYNIKQNFENRYNLSQNGFCY